MGALGGVIFVLAIIFMVMFHEFGHYVTARRFGMKVTEFFLGFGPRLWFVRKGETDYGVKPLIFLGGYVKIVGMNPLEEIPPAEESRTFRGKAPWQKLIVLVAGSATHFLTGLLMLLIVFSVIGQPGPPLPVLEAVPHVEGERSPAEIAGLLPGDRIVAVDGRPVTTWQEVSDFIAAHPGATVRFGVRRGSSDVEVETVLARREDGRGFLGVVASRQTERAPLHVGLGRSLTTSWEIGYQGMKGLIGFFAPDNLSAYMRQLGGDEPDPRGENRVVSVVGAVRIGSQLEEVAVYLHFLAAVNIFVGLVNLLPLFPLDGGWVAVTVYEKIASLIRRRKVSADFRKLVPVTYAVLAVFAFLAVTSIYLDITSPIDLDL